jgi:hypothetical protein
MRRRWRSLLLVLLAGVSGCAWETCIERGPTERSDRCAEGLACVGCEPGYPVRCDEHHIATNCRDEGFDLERRGIWTRAPACG